MSSIVIKDLDPNDSYLTDLTEEEFLSIIGGKPPWHKRWWGKALIAIGTGIVTSVATSLIINAFEP